MSHFPMAKCLKTWALQAELKTICHLQGLGFSSHILDVCPTLYPWTLDFLSTEL